MQILSDNDFKKCIIIGLGIGIGIFLVLFVYYLGFNVGNLMYSLK